MAGGGRVVLAVPAQRVEHRLDMGVRVPPVWVAMSWSRNSGGSRHQQSGHAKCAAGTRRPHLLGQGWWVARVTTRPAAAAPAAR